MDNATLARTFEEVADLLEIDGANPFRVRAYRNAARAVAEDSTPLARRLERGEDLTELPAIGKDIAAHGKELVETGRLELLDRLAERVPRSLIDVVRLPVIGPKRARELWQRLGVTTVGELEEAARGGRVARLPGFGLKSQQRILEGIAHQRLHSGRFPLLDAGGQLEPLLDHLRETPGLECLEVAGSFRRRQATVGDLDLLAVADDAAAVMERLAAYPAAASVERSGETWGSLVLDTGLEVDLRVVPARSLGAARIHYTGAKSHNVALRRRAVERGLRMSEYGLFRPGEPEAEGADDPWAGEWIGGKTERAVYRHLDLPWIPPELREDRGEIEAAERRDLPDLVALGDVRGDLQMHSTWSDGRDTIEAMVAACVARGYEYLAITDHSRALAVAHGLDGRRLRRQAREIDKVQERHDGIRVLRGVEVEILEDGSLDLDDEVLAELDLVVAAIHSHFDLPAAAQTRRVLRALEHPRVHLLAHPTGRRGDRPPMRLDLEAVLEAAAEHRVAVEHNALPQRLDLEDTQLQRARELGARVAIDTDAHRVADLDFMALGVDQARRGWLEAKDVINTWPLDELLEWLER